MASKEFPRCCANYQCEFTRPLLYCLMSKDEQELRPTGYTHQWAPMEAAIRSGSRDSKKVVVALPSSIVLPCKEPIWSGNKTVDLQFIADPLSQSLATREATFVLPSGAAAPVMDLVLRGALAATEVQAE